MNWVGEYIIESSGLCRWSETMQIEDPVLLKICREEDDMDDNEDDEELWENGNTLE